MRTRVLNGTYYDIGFQRAGFLRDFVPPRSTAEQAAFARQCYELVKATYPPILDEFRGLRDGVVCDEQDLFVYYFARKESLVGGCTAVAALPSITHEGRMIVGRNYDWAYSDRRWCELRLTQPAGGSATLGYSHHWAGSPDVLSARGLLVVMSSLPGPEPQRPGLQWNLVIDIAVATCQNVEEAVAFARDVPHLRSMAYLTADGEGNVAVVEAQPGKVSVRRPRKGLLVATNHRVDTLDRPVGPASQGSRARYARAKALAEGVASRIGRSDIEDLLRDHEVGICLGDHSGRQGPADQGSQWATIWSTVSQPAEKMLWIAPGPPCQTRYERVDGLFQRDSA